jgi:hypothetical protein
MLSYIIHVQIEAKKEYSPMFGSLFLLNHTVIIKLKVRIKKKNTINTNRQRRDATI